MLAIGGVKADSGTKLYLSNLDYGVSDDDIEGFFSSTYRGTSGFATCVALGIYVCFCSALDIVTLFGGRYVSEIGVIKSHQY